MNKKTAVIAVSLAMSVFSLPASAASDCTGLPSHAALKAALDLAVAAEASGLNLHMWATVVNKDGMVCAVAFSGANRSTQWRASRAISAQKANTAGSLSLDASAGSAGSGGPLALSTANLYSAVQPGGSLYGLQHSNPVDTAVAYGGLPDLWGTALDSMVGKKPGGINVFGGGLALYAPAGVLKGGVGVSGDTSCADHMIAWRLRNNLNLDYLFSGGIPGVAGIFAGDATHPDNILFDIAPNPAGGTGASASGFGHPTCLNTADPLSLPAAR